MAEPAETVSTRLPPTIVRLLDEEAEKRGVNRSECMRRILMERLTEPSAEERFAQLYHKVEDLREDLATAAAQILFELSRTDGKKLTRDEIERWVRQTLLER